MFFDLEVNPDYISAELRDVTDSDILVNHIHS